MRFHCSRWMTSFLSAAILPAFLTSVDCGGSQPANPYPGLLADQEARDGFYPLFNGADLTGWEVTGDNKSAFFVEDSVIACNGKHGGWLKTTREYENFVLRMEYKISPGGNSGLFFRATREGNPAFTGMEMQILDDHGKPANANSTGSIYDSIAPRKNPSRPAGEWNQVELTCQDRMIRVVMNGDEIVNASIDDYTEPIHGHTPLAERAVSGFIGMQDHGAPVWFRNIRIKPLCGGVGWRALFNGEDLDGWTLKGDARWRVEDGAITGSGANGYAVFDEMFGDFMIRAQIKVSERGNGGIFFRSPNDPSQMTGRGYEAQVDNHSEGNLTGSIYNRFPATKLVSRDEHWFTMLVRAEGDRLSTEVNGQTVVVGRNRTFERGRISLQCHDGHTVIQYRCVEVKPLESGE